MNWEAENLTRNDLQLVQTATRRGWDIPDSFLKQFPEECGKIVFGKDKDDNYEYPEAMRLAAIRLVIEMKKQNLKEQLLTYGQGTGQTVNPENQNSEEFELQKRRIIDVVAYSIRQRKDSGGAGSDRKTVGGAGDRSSTTKRKPRKKAKPK